MSKKPTEKFSFGGNFNAGTGAAGESSDAVKVIPYSTVFHQLFVAKPVS